MLDVIWKYYYIFNPIKCLIHLFHFKSILATENTFMISSSSCWYLLYTATAIHIFIKYAKGLPLCIFWNVETRRRKENCSKVYSTNQRSQNSNSSVSDYKAQRYNHCIHCSINLTWVIFGGENIKYEYKYKRFIWSHLSKEMLAFLMYISTKGTNKAHFFHFYSSQSPNLLQFFISLRSLLGKSALII